MVKIPENYTPSLGLYETQKAIGLIKNVFLVKICAALHLKRVTAPLFVDPSTGLNDDLNGVERPVEFDIPAVGGNAQVVHSLAKWKRLALKRYGFFPSYAVGYMISNEKFWEPLRDKVNILKIRASYGKIGNDEIGGSRRFAYNTTMNTNAGGFTFGDLGQTNLPGYSTGEYGNPDVAWEEATKADVGIELGLFNKIKIQADYFYEKREGIFIQRQPGLNVGGAVALDGKTAGYFFEQAFGTGNLSGITLWGR